MIFLSIALLMGCYAQPKQDETKSQSGDPSDRYLMLDELPDTALAHIRQAITDADTLTEHFVFQDEEWQEGNPKIYPIMEYAMQRSFNYEGPYVYAYEWACQDSVANHFLNYLRDKGEKVAKMDSTHFQRVIDEIDCYTEPFAEGPQMWMNAVSHIDMNMHSYKTIGTYKDMVALCEDKDLRKAYFMDYADWIDLFSAVVDRQEGGYSMFPLEVNGFGEDMMKFRSALLMEEMDLKRSGTPCAWDAKAHAIDWKAENGDLLKPWYDRRMQEASQIKDEKFAQAFKAMTDKIAYLFLKNIHFGFDDEGMDDEDMNDEE